MAIILGANTLSGAYEVANSCRFNDGDNPYMHKTPGSAGNRRTWTFSCWVKRTTPGANQRIFSQGDQAGGDPQTFLGFQSNDTLRFNRFITGVGEEQLTTNRLFRDPSAWYSIIIAVDTTNGTAGNRYRMYINGTEETSFGTDQNPALNQDTDVNNDSKFELGSTGATTQNFDGYMAEVCLIDGLQLTPTSFGEFNSDSPTIWQPIDVSGLTFGTNGFYLDFEDSANLGNDANGGTDLTEVNLDATDSATDVPTNNFCTFNPLIAPEQKLLLSEGNTVATYNGAYWATAMGTFGLSAGKWWWECKMSVVGQNYNHGVLAESVNLATANPMNQTGYTGFYNYDGGEMKKDASDTTADYGTFSSSEVMGIALNMDDKEISIYKDGSAIVSDFALSTTITGVAFPITVAYQGSSPVSNYNFGGCSGFTISSAANDADGYGIFEHAPPSGYYAICSKNLGAYGG